MKGCGIKDHVMYMHIGDCRCGSFSRVGRTVTPLVEAGEIECGGSTVIREVLCPEERWWRFRVGRRDFEVGTGKGRGPLG